MRISAKVFTDFSEFNIFFIINTTQISYYIIFSPEFKNVEISYCDGENTYKETSDQLNEVYEIDANKVLYEDNKIKAIFDIYLENGEKQTIELP